jgi:nucleotide-binding universal stress UspA family protein
VVDRFLRLRASFAPWLLLRCCKAAAQTLEASHEEWPSLVVIGSRSLAGIMRTRAGSVSTRGVTASRGPVLVCPDVG